MAEVVSTSRPGAGAGAAVGGRRDRGFGDYDAALAAYPATPHRRRVRGTRDAVLVGDHGTAQGGAQGAARHPHGRPVGGPGPDRVGAGEPRSRARSRCTCRPRPCTTRPRSSTACRCCASGRRWWSWSTSTPPGAWRSSSATGSPTPNSCPPCSCACCTCPKNERRRYDLSSLRSVVHAAAPCPVAVKRQMLEWWGPIIDEYYAGTEDIGSTWITAAEWLAHPGSVGRPLTPAHIVGPDGPGARPRPGRRRLLRGRPAFRVPQRPVGQDGVDGQRRTRLADPR